AANGDETCAAVPCTETIVPVICSALQLVGLKTNCGRSIVTLTVCTRSGTPSRICGRGSLVTVSAAVLGSMFSAARTTTVPRLKGPALAGTMIDRPYGAPL